MKLVLKFSLLCLLVNNFSAYAYKCPEDKCLTKKDSIVAKRIIETWLDPINIQSTISLTTKCQYIEQGNSGSARLLKKNFSDLLCKIYKQKTGITLSIAIKKEQLGERCGRLSEYRSISFYANHPHPVGRMSYKITYDEMSSGILYKDGKREGPFMVTLFQCDCEKNDQLVKHTQFVDNVLLALHPQWSTLGGIDSVLIKSFLLSLDDDKTDYFTSPEYMKILEEETETAIDSLVSDAYFTTDSTACAVIKSYGKDVIQERFVYTVFFDRDTHAIIKKQFSYQHLPRMINTPAYHITVYKQNSLPETIVDYRDRSKILNGMYHFERRLMKLNKK